MRGHIRRRGSSWTVVLDVGADPATGKRRQRWHSGYRTKRDTERGLADRLAALQRGEYVAPSELTLAAYLRETWLPAIGASIRSSTLARYQLDAATLTRELGAVSLQRLTGAQLDALYAKRREQGASPASVRHLHAATRRALRDAVRNGLVTRNAADAATPPRVARAEPRTWTGAELRKYLASVADDRLGAAWVLLATTGMRRGELLALRWRDVDFDAKRVSVARSLVSVRNRLSFSEPKTRRGRRSIALDSQTVAVLRAHRKRQSEERLALGLGNPGDDGLVFTDPLGEPVKPDSFSQFFDRRVKRLGLPRIRLHDLRHTHATLALAAGVHPKVVSERLGHASVAFTLDTYSHAIPAMEEQAAEQIAALVRG